MTVNIWKTYNYVHCGWRNKHRRDPCNYEYYLTSSENRGWKKHSGPYEFWTPWPLRYQCMGSNPVQTWIFFRPLFATSQVVFITVRITSKFVSSTTVHIYDFHIYTVRDYLSWSKTNFQANIKRSVWQIVRQMISDLRSERVHSINCSTVIYQEPHNKYL